MSNSGQNPLFPMWCAEDSRARTYPTPGVGLALWASGLDFGRIWPESSERYLRDGSLRKMYRPFDLRGLHWSCKISARSGIALNGTVFPLVPLVRSTDGIGSGSWPTPTSRDWKDGTARSCRNVPSNFLLGREVHAREDYKTTGSLNPRWVEWLMGYPDGWTDLDNSATP